LIITRWQEGRGAEVNTEMDDDSQIDELAILEMVWGGVQRRHPDVPDVVIPLPVPLPRYPDGREPPVAHFTPGPPPTVIVSDWAVTSPLSPKEEILKHLLHEAAHALAHKRGVNDGREPYHTKAFGALAAELGLWVDDSDVQPFGRGRGYSVTHLAPGTADEYAEELRLLAKLRLLAGAEE
jgi:hypothetical protein